MDNKWAKPQEATGLDAAFGGNVTELMPTRDEIPSEFWRGRTKWNTVVSDWFFRGLTDAKWKPREGIETDAALRHLAAILRSWEPKHEHKEAAVAYLASLWFKDVTYAEAAS